MFNGDDKFYDSSEKINSDPVPQPKKDKIPVQPPPPKPKAATKKVEKDKDAVERDKLVIKANEYLRSKRFGEILAEAGFVQLDRHKTTKEQAEAQYEGILNMISSSTKRCVVDRAFFDGGVGVCKFLGKLADDIALIQLGDALKEKRELFEDELEEIAIEMDGATLPGPKYRLIMKVIGLYGMIKSEKIKKEDV